MSGKSIKWIAAAVGMAALTACSSGGKSPDKGAQEAAKPPEPYMMKVYAAGVQEAEFNSRYRSALESKFPYITFQFMANGKGASIQELVAAGEVPDLIRTDTPTLKAGYLDLKLGYDMRDVVKANKYDLKRFNPSFIQEIQDMAPDGQLYGLPVPPFFPVVLYYNKDLFNKFGVAYPKDGMSYDEVYELAKKLSTTDGGVTYRGFSSDLRNTIRDNQLSLPMLDPAKDGVGEMEKWKSIFNNLVRFYQIPNNTIADNSGLELGAFAKGNVAMQVASLSIYSNLPPEIDWDVVSVPMMAGAPQKMGQRAPAYWSISATSKHKEDAFKVIMEMLSDENQMKDSRNGFTTTLVNEEIRKNLGKDHAVFSKKHMDAIYFYDVAPPAPKRKPGLADVPGRTQEAAMFASFIEYAQGNSDVNTALRKAEETLQKALAEEKSK
ncbi:ABC transporter substrate-binding protein [Paenibacillus ginsengarvi]|uniref:Extracellular solute-binding protein n=1 Tax=Paenibacillus ginsengarvi TaxID=400777 RepID=A0A3B0CHU0_9BACL|nr:extracellular solute-binding protein [Paenibacillus ginsengarvi]RKN84943.1 extracellular solute-binding protein [Paenibacillus ginsengarvi]